MPRTLRIKTPFVNAAIEGTEFLVQVEPLQASISVFEGSVTADNPVGTARVNPAESAVA